MVARTIPDNVLAARSFEDICRYRIAAKDSLARFREKIWEMASDLDDNITDPLLWRKIRRVIETKIVPEERRLDDSLKRTFEQMFGGIAGKLGSAVLSSAAAAVPTLSIASISGLSPGIVVSLGAASFLSGLGIALPSIVSYVNERRDLERSFFYFLWNFNAK